MRTFLLTSPEVGADGRMPVEFTLDGRDRALPLRWGDPPPGTKSYALMVVDPDAPSGSFVHWLAWNIPADARQLPDVAHGAPAMQQGVNGFGRIGWTGPRPPHGDPPHHYHFRLFALDTAIALPAGAERPALEDAIRDHVVGTAELVVTYQRREKPQHAHF